MRKIYLIILSFFVVSLSGCFSNNINSSIYISSIGFEVNEGKIKAYFLSNPLTNISRGSDGNSNGNESEYVSVETDSIYEAFLKAEQSMLSPLNYRHVKTVIFHKDVFATKYIRDFFEFMRSVMYVTYNYYVFATEDKIEEIYSFQNPEQISYQYSVLSSPNLLKFHEYGTENNLLESVLSPQGQIGFVVGDTMPTVIDDYGNELIYTFTVDEITSDYATITFTVK